jgi:hypothetical protein
LIFGATLKTTKLFPDWSEKNAERRLLIIVELLPLLFLLQIILSSKLLQNEVL